MPLESSIMSSFGESRESLFLKAIRTDVTSSKDAPPFFRRGLVHDRGHRLEVVPLGSNFHSSLNYSPFNRSVAFILNYSGFPNS